MAKKDKGDFMSRAGKITKKGFRESKKFAIGIGKKTTGEQRFLGKTLPKSLWKVAKWGFKHPISATALTFVPAAIKKFGPKKRIQTRSKFRTITQPKHGSYGGKWIT